MKKETVESMVELFANEQLHQMIFSNPVQKDGILKVRIRPVNLRGRLLFQAEELVGTQAFHKNLLPEEICGYVTGLLSGGLRNGEVISGLGSAVVLVSKKGTVTVKIKRAAQTKQKENQEEDRLASEVILAHNRKKRYVLEEGKPVEFLVDLGVMTKEGKIVRTRYDKFRQINRFLEFIEDILPNLDPGRETTIIDFGCGKSYLTFAMYYYLKVLKGYPVRITGLDLKTDVIEHCSRLAKKFGYDSLEFLHGDIASYEGTDEVDMVVTLHACDTATDYALEKAVRWNAKVILSVPCCQHEVNKQMKSELFAPVFHYGIIKERMAALYTDALRAEVLEAMGYRVQILEFIDMEHTPKNLLIRAVKQGKRKENREVIEAILREIHAEPTLYRLLMEEK